MQDNRLRIGLAFVAVALGLGALTIIFWDFVRETIITPIYYSLWIGGLFINSVPQGVFLVILLIICAIIALNALSNSIGGQPRAAHQSTPATLETRYHHWERMCTNLYLGHFSRHLFAAEARRLILSILAFEYRVEVRQVEAMIRNNQIDLPEGIRKLMLNKDDLPAEPPLSEISRMLKRLRREPIRDPQVDAFMNEIITFIEAHLEIMHVGNEPNTLN
jgi:hypothetical protein